MKHLTCPLECVYLALKQSKPGIGRFVLREGVWAVSLTCFQATSFLTVCRRHFVNVPLTFKNVKIG